MEPTSIEVQQQLHQSDSYQDMQLVEAAVASENQQAVQLEQQQMDAEGVAEHLGRVSEITIH